MATNEVVVKKKWTLESAIRSLFYYYLLGQTSNPVSTPNAYEKLLQRYDGKPLKLLDVGCGDGVYFSVPSIIALIRRNPQWSMHCVDVDAEAVKICQHRIEKANLQSIITAAPTDLRDVSDKFDVILFMESFPVIDDKLMKELVIHASKLAPELQMYHNLVQKSTPILKFIKPRIKYITLVDFGKLTTVDEMNMVCTQWGLPYEIEPLLSCTYGEMNPIMSFLPVANHVITQYLVTLKCSAK